MGPDEAEAGRKATEDRRTVKHREKVLWSAFLLLRYEGNDLFTIVRQLSRAFAMSREELVVALRQCQVNVEARAYRQKVSAYEREKDRRVMVEVVEREEVVSEQ